MSVRILIGDCRERMKDLPDASVDSVVCDPPYHLTSIVKRFGSATAAPAKVGKTGAFARASKGFMGQTWDGGDVAFQPETWAEVLRVLTPGGHLVAFSGTRTYHRMAVAIEDAGFEIRDQLAWLYGSGFPKSLDVSKAIDKQRDDKPDIHRVCAFVAAGRDAAAKANREIDALFGFNGMAGHWTNSKGPQAQVPRWEQWLKLRAFLSLSDEMDAEVWRLNGRKGKPGENWKVIGEREAGAATGGVYGTYAQRVEINDPTESAQQWRGWGTALKPSWEPICLARKPLDGTVANNVLTHGTGALNIDGCRIDMEGEKISPRGSMDAATDIHEGWSRPWMADKGKSEARLAAAIDRAETLGRWPANLCHDGSEEVLAGFPETAPSSGHTRNNTPEGVNKEHSIGRSKDKWQTSGPEDFGSSARFFKSAEYSEEEWLFCRAKAILSTCHNDLANTADSSSKLSKEAAAFVLSGAATSAVREVRLLSGSTTLFTSVTPSELRRISEAAIAAILILENGCWREWLQGRHILNGCRVRFVENSAPTGTITTIIDHWTSCGSVEPATFSTTLPNSELGAKGLNEPKRFHYCAKATTDERGEGNNHPTVKPVALMRWLVRLVTPKGGTVLDPFMGSGSTALACDAEQFNFIGCELSADYAAIAERRVREAAGLFAEVKAA